MRLTAKLLLATLLAAPIAAPAQEDPALTARVRELRSAGERVIAMLPGQEGGPGELGCDRQLVRREGNWTVEEL